jgi:LysR family glycine cleavage system transcriptional activator
MKRKIPSTVALSLFECAARHQSFARAAHEMCVTESAVSRQISALENYLGVQLFDRVRKQVRLTQAGVEYARNVSVNLSELELHTRAVMSSKGVGGVLELAVIPTFANRWLMPRLHEFRELHSDITINLSETPNPFPFRGANFDAALHFDHPDWADVVKVPLFDEELVPVVSPRHYVLSELHTPDDLAMIPLLYKASREDAWKRWFEAAGHREREPGPAMRFELYAMIIEAARAGLGAGLVPRFYVEGEVRRGDLAIPFDVSLKHEKQYCLVYPEWKQTSNLVQRFRDWIVKTADDYNRHRTT